jgi:DNA/RNA endonuclease YhcR with UshA esterase domain
LYQKVKVEKSKQSDPTKQKNSNRNSFENCEIQRPETMLLKAMMFQKNQNQYPGAMLLKAMMIQNQ